MIDTADTNADALTELKDRLGELRERIALVEREIALKDTAKLLQATEYERRLDGLNHEAARLATMQAEYVARGVYETESKSSAEKTEKNAASLIEMTGKVSYLERQITEVRTSNQWLSRLVTTALISSVASIIVFLVTRAK